MIRSVKVLDTDTGSVNVIREGIEEDFFYFNQIAEFDGKVYAMGKDHVHILSKNGVQHQIIEYEGDYGQNEDEI